MKFSEKKISIIAPELLKYGRKAVIAHCISCDCAMGAGVVVPIKSIHPNLKAECSNYVLEMKRLNLNPLGTAFRFFDGTGNPVYNLFSKVNVWDNASKLGGTIYLDNLRLALEDLRDQMLFRKEKCLAMPKIASGLDRCNWEEVKNLILTVFQDTDISILICYI